MRYQFKYRKLENLYYDGRDINQYPPEVGRSFYEAMEIISAAVDVRDLYAFKGFHFEKLKGARIDQYSMRLNNQFRLVLTKERDEHGQYLLIISIEDYH